MAERTPVEVTNLDRYGDPALDWRRVDEGLTAGPPSGTFFLGTIGPDGRPHAAGVGAVWFDGDLYIVSGPGTRKSRNLAADSACTVSAGLPGIDIVVTGAATRVTDAATLERVAGHYREVAGWPAEVQGDAFTAPFSAPSAGPPPWYLYVVAIQAVVGVAAAEPHGATRWRFEH